MRKFLTILLVTIGISCSEDKPVAGDLKDYLPEETAVILQLKNPDLFFSNLNNNEFLKQNAEHPFSKELQEKISILDFFPVRQEALLALVGKQNGEVDFSFISRGRLEPTALDSIKNKQVETLTSPDHEIKKYELEGKTAFSAQIDSITIISSSKKLLENSLLGTFKPSTGLQTAFKAASAKQPSVFVQHEKAAPILKGIFPEVFKTLSGWTVLDTEISQTQLRFDGISATQDSLPHLLNVFKGAGVASNALASIVPASSQGFTSITYRDFAALYKNLNAFKKRTSEAPSTEASLLNNASEAGIIDLGEEKVFVLRSLDPETAQLSFEGELVQVETFRDFAIFEYPGSSSFQEILSPLLNPESLEFFTIFETWLLFSDDPEALKQVISAAQNDAVLASTDPYKNTAEGLSSDASLLVVRNNLAEGAVPEDGFDYTGFPITAVQFIYQDDFAHVHAALSKNEVIQSSQATQQVAAINLEAPLAGKPVFFPNHRTKGMDIAVQDEKNILYLISPEGRIYWKKDLKYRILGEVQAVDILRNGRYQLAFATPGELHVIDRNGNPVKPFPLKFKDAITQPVSIFDYENNRDYRFLIVQGNEVYMYDRKGRPVRGFTFDRAASEIIQPPKHIRIGRKDYILAAESSGKLNILSRTGKIRVPLNDNLDFSHNKWYEYNGNFVSANTSGEIVKVSEDGNIKREDLNLSENTRIAATEETLVILSENELTIKGKRVSLDFGLYSDPQVFFLNNKIYASVTDLQAKKVYLFDSNANLMRGFPVYGTSLIDLANADDDASLELVVQGEEDGVLIYAVSSAQ